MKFNPQLYSGIDSSLINLFQNNNKPILVYYFSTEMCSPCLEDIKDTIQSVFPDYKIRNDILFLSNDLELRLRNNYFGKKVACTKDQNIISIFNQYHVPTFFMVDTSLRIHNVLVASKQTPVITRNYLNIVKKRYLHK